MDINELLEKTGLSIKEMYFITGVDRDTLFKWRKNPKRMSAAILRLFFVINWLYENGLIDKLKKELEKD